MSTECSTDRDVFGAAEIGDHPLADGRAVASVLDDLYIAAFAGLLEAEEHGPSLGCSTEMIPVCALSPCPEISASHQGAVDSTV